MPYVPMSKLTTLALFLLQWLAMNGDLMRVAGT